MQYNPPTMFKFSSPITVVSILNFQWMDHMSNHHFLATSTRNSILYNLRDCFVDNTYVVINTYYNMTVW